MEWLVMVLFGVGLVAIGISVLIQDKEIEEHRKAIEELEHLWKFHRWEG